VDDRVAIDIIDTGHDAILEFVLRCDPDVTQNRTGKLGEEALDEIEPGAMRGREGELEPASRSSGEPSFGFSRDVRGMIVQNQLDGGAAGIGGIKEFEEFDKLSAAVAISDQSMNLAGEQINASQQAERAMAS